MTRIVDSDRKHVANVLLRQLASRSSFMNYGSVMDDVFLVVCTLYSKKRQEPKANMQLNTTKVTLMQYHFLDSILYFNSLCGDQHCSLTKYICQR